METPASLATVRRLAASTPRVVTSRRTAVAISRRRSSWSTCLGIWRSTPRFVMRMHCIESGSQCDRIVNLKEGQVQSGVTHNGDVQIAYEDFGKPGGRPLLLISGLDSQMIDDMMAALDAMGWESANLAGLSMGGGLAQFAALLQPERVRTVTAISAIPQYGQ